MDYRIAGDGVKYYHTDGTLQEQLNRAMMGTVSKMQGVATILNLLGNVVSYSEDVNDRAITNDDLGESIKLMSSVSEDLIADIFEIKEAMQSDEVVDAMKGIKGNECIRSYQHRPVTAEEENKETRKYFDMIKKKK